MVMSIYSMYVSVYGNLGSVLVLSMGGRGGGGSCGCFGFSGKWQALCLNGEHPMPCVDSYLDLLMPRIPGFWCG